MKKPIKKLLIGTSAVSAVVASLLALQQTVAKYLVDFALDRKEETEIKPNKAVDLVSGSSFVDEETVKRVTEATEKLKKQDLQTVKIESFDGYEMTGHYYPHESSKRIIIAMHGWRSSWTKDFAIISEFWHNQNCSILFAEQRGQGNSGGDYMGFGLMERYDCQRWAKWVSENISSELPIYLCGLSMGATTVLMASSLDMPKNVSGIMADCGFTSPHDIGKHVVEHNLHLSYGIVGKMADDIFKRKIQIGTQDYSTTEALKETEIPVFFVHGTDDTFVPVTMTYENYKACASPKKLLVVPGASHATSYLVSPEEYEKAVLEFWNEFDK